MYETLRSVFGKNNEEWIQDKLDENASWWKKYRYNLKNSWNQLWTEIRGYKFNQDPYCDEVDKQKVEYCLSADVDIGKMKKRTIYFCLSSTEHHNLTCIIKTSDTSTQDTNIATPWNNGDFEKYKAIFEKKINSQELNDDEQKNIEEIKNLAFQQEEIIKQIASKEFIRKSREWTQTSLPSNANIFWKKFRDFNNWRHKLLANFRGYHLARTPYKVKFVDVLPDKKSIEEYTLYLQKIDENNFRYSVKTPNEKIIENIPLENNLFLQKGYYELLKEKQKNKEHFNQFNNKIIASILEETGKKKHTAEICTEVKERQKHQQADRYEAFSDSFAVGANSGYSSLATLNNLVILADLGGLELLAMVTYGISVFIAQAGVRAIFNLIELKNKRNKNLNIWQKFLVNTGIFLTALVLLSLSLALNVVYQEFALNTMAWLSLIVSAIRFTQCLIFVLHHSIALLLSGFNIFSSKNRHPNELQARHLTQLSKRFIQMKAAAWLFVGSLISLALINTKVGKIFTICAFTFNTFSIWYTAAREFEPFKTWFRFNSKHKIIENESVESKVKRFGIAEHKKIHHNDLRNELNHIKNSFFSKKPPSSNIEEMVEKHYKFVLVSQKPDLNSLKKDTIYIYKNIDSAEAELSYCFNNGKNTTENIEKVLDVPMDIKTMLENSLTQITPQETASQDGGKRLHDIDCIHAILQKTAQYNDTDSLIQIQTNQREKAVKFMHAVISAKIEALNQSIMELEKKPLIPFWPQSTVRRLKLYHKKYFLELLDKLITGDYSTNTNDEYYNADTEETSLIKPKNPFEGELGDKIKCLEDIDPFFDNYRKIEATQTQKRPYWIQKLGFTNMSTLEINVYRSFKNRNCDTEVIFRAATEFFRIFGKPDTSNSSSQETMATNIPTLPQYNRPTFANRSGSDPTTLMLPSNFSRGTMRTNTTDNTDGDRSTTPSPEKMVENVENTEGIPDYTTEQFQNRSHSSSSSSIGSYFSEKNSPPLTRVDPYRSYSTCSH